MRILLLLSVLLASSDITLAQAPREIPLWKDGTPEPRVPSEPAENQQTGKDGLTRRFHVSNPRLFVHQPTGSIRTGAAVIVVPGGGFARLADEHEGSDVCRWLTSHGIVAYQLAYRVPTNQQANPVAGPAQDLQKALLVVRERADEFEVDADRIGVLGFSAGGQTALVATAGKIVIPFDDEPSRLKPNLLLLLYPYQIQDPETKSIRSDVDLDSGLPPTFIAQAADDSACPPEGSALLFSELVKRKIPAEIHIYENGGHGFGMRPRAGAPGSKDWSGRAVEWLRLHKFAAEPPAADGEKPK